MALTLPIPLSPSALSPVCFFFLNSHTTGASSIRVLHETTRQGLLSTLSAIVETIVRLHAVMHKAVRVSSGTIGVSLQRMAMPAHLKSLPGKQASQKRAQKCFSLMTIRIGVAD